MGIVCMYVHISRYLKRHDRFSTYATYCMTASIKMSSSENNACAGHSGNALIMFIAIY